MTTTSTVADKAPMPDTAPPGLWAMLRDDCRCVFARDPAARSMLEVITIYPGVQAIATHRIAHALWGRGWKYLARAIAFVSRAWTSIEIHPAAHIGRRFFIDHGCGVVIGETTVIGDDVTLYHGVTLGGTSWNPGKRHPTLADGVVVGAGAKILGNITIGAHARVAANSVVIADVPPTMTVVGIPGRIVKPRDARRIRAGIIDLDHHEVPDPVGRALHCLIDRVEFLEARLREYRQGDLSSPDCHDCSTLCPNPMEDHHADA